MNTERLSFAGHDGSLLDARLDLPEGEVRAAALFAHCFTCSKDILPARRIAARLTGAGIAVLRFDFTGLGHSGGEFANTTFTSNVDDLHKAAEAMAARGLAPSLLIGHSLGGAAVLRAANGIESTRVVVTLGTPFSPGHVTKNFSAHLEQIMKDGEAQVALGGRDFCIRQDFVQDITAERLGPAITSLNAALLVMHAPRDSVVGIDNAEEIFKAAKHPKSFVTLDDADHLISDGEDADYAAGVIAAWAARYLELAPEAPVEHAPEGVVRAEEADPDGFLQDIFGGSDHHMFADEPEAYGGTNKGLSPYGFLSAGLAACTSMTLRMYARRKAWPLEHVFVDVTHAKVHAEDAAKTDETPAVKVDEFRRVITLTGALDAEQRARLLEIADQCPVHKTLHQDNQIVTRLAK
ncbi:MAG: bifunctional alpha/beta hydrolase/OsmC family protein [Maritimibacter sp.]